MNEPQAIVGIGTLLSGAGIWLLLPGGGRSTRMLGLVLALAGGGCLAARGLPLEAVGHADDIVFWALAGLTVIAIVTKTKSSGPTGEPTCGETNQGTKMQVKSLLRAALSL